MNFIASTVGYVPNCSNCPNFDQPVLKPNNQVALLLPLVVRPPEAVQGSEWDILRNELNQKDELIQTIEVTVNSQLVEENESLKDELRHLKKKVLTYEQLLSKLIPKLHIRDEMISHFESLIDLWKNDDFHMASDDNIDTVQESMISNKDRFINRSSSKSIADGSNEMVELVPGSNVSLPKQFIIQTREMANDSPTYYMRRILAYYFDQETFSKSSARGKGATKSLDTKITNAVWGHTLSQFPNCTLTTLVEDTNRRCAEARRTINRQSEGRKLSINKPGTVEQEAATFRFQQIPMYGNGKEKI